jgi:hypothetical protein
MSDVLTDYQRMTDADIQQAEKDEQTRLQIPKGTYEGQIVSGDVKTSDRETWDNGDRNLYFGIPVARLRADLFDVPGPDGFTTGTRPVFFNVSDANVRDDSGRLGLNSVNYVKLSKALGMPAAPLEDVVAKATNGPRLRFKISAKGYVNHVEGL